MKIYFCEKCGVSIPLQEVVGGRATARDGKTYCQSCRPEDALPSDDLKLYFCDNCKVSIPLQDVITNRAKAVGEQMLCIECSRLTQPQRKVRKDRIEQDLKEREERRYRLHFCDSCSTSIPQSHLVTGRAVVRGGRTFCERCKDRVGRKKPGALSSIGVILVLGAVFIAGYVAIGAVPNLMAKTDPEKAKAEEEALKQDILDVVRPQIEDQKTAFGESLKKHRQDVEQMQGKIDTLTKGFQELDGTARGMEKSQSALRAELLERLGRTENALRDAQAKLSLLAAKLDEQIALASRRPEPAPPKAAPEVKRPAKPEPEPEPEEEASPEVKDWLEQLKDPDAGVRFSAAVELGKSGYNGAIPPLVKTLEDDKDTFVRRAAARSLGELSAWAAVPALIKTLEAKEYFVAITAHKALLKITGQDFGFKENLKRSELRKVVSKAKDWWEENKDNPPK